MQALSLFDPRILPPRYLLVLVFGALHLFVLLVALILQRRSTSRKIERMSQEISREVMRCEQRTIDAIGSVRASASAEARSLREEVGSVLRSLETSIHQLSLERMRIDGEHASKLREEVRGSLEKVAEAQERALFSLQESVDRKLEGLRQDNASQLESMRLTVDEKLQGTLERRLGESFRHVSERLEVVHRGLGEMQELAHGVGDLKRVLTNVKTRGTWGEVQLGALLEQLLTHEQYASNVKVIPTSNDFVEFAIKLPGKANGSMNPVWLPIDSKFPLEEYQRLVELRAQGEGGIEEEMISKTLEQRLKLCAKKIAEKYISPPFTTDFAVMFLPTEGLYAEAARRPGLIETLQRDTRVVISGPSTFAALLNSLQMGFRTVAIEERSSEVWSLLGRVRSEFSKFGEVLDKVKRNLNQASNTIDGASTRARSIERALQKVSSDASPTLEIEEEVEPKVAP